jgi:hypothetical protein
VRPSTFLLSLLVDQNTDTGCVVKGKEAEVLADAVKKENMRLEAYRARDKYVRLHLGYSVSPSFRHQPHSPAHQHTKQRSRNQLVNCSGKGL